MTNSTKPNRKRESSSKASPEEIAWEHAPEQRARRRRGLRAAVAAYMKGGDVAVREHLAKVRAARQKNGEAGVDQYLDQVENQAKTDQTSNAANPTDQVARN